MNFEEAVRVFTCKFPGLELHQFLFDDRWFDAHAFFESCSHRLKWINFNRARQTIIQSAQSFGATAEPITMQPQKLSLALHMLNSLEGEIHCSDQQSFKLLTSSIEDSQGTTFSCGQNHANSLSVLNQIETNPGSAVVSLSEKQRSIAAALIYAQACFLLADTLASYCNDRATVIPFAQLLNKSEAARTLINETDKTGIMILDDFSSRLRHLQAQFAKIRPPRHLPQISWSTVAGATGIVLLAAAVFIFLITPHPSTTIPDSEGLKIGPSPAPEPPQIAGAETGPTGVPEEPGPGPEEITEGPYGQPAPERQTAPDSASQIPQQSGPETPGDKDVSKSVEDETQQSSPPKNVAPEDSDAGEKNDYSPATSPQEQTVPGSDSGQGSTVPDDDNLYPEPEKHPSTQPPLVNANVIALLDNQDLVLLNRYMEYGVSKKYYLWGNRASRLLFGAKPEPARSIGNNYICRDVVLLAGPDSSKNALPHYRQRTTFCRDIDRPVWKLLQ